MNYWKIKKFDIANGSGLRTSIWVTGCHFHCKDCFNQELWEFSSGKLFDSVAEKELFEKLSDSHCQGLSVLGGEPLMQGQDMVNLLQKVKSMYPPKDIWIWTGFYLEEALQDETRKKILSYCDVVVDGRFDHSKHVGHLYFRGSSNQSIYRNINGEFVKIENPEEYFSKI